MVVPGMASGAWRGTSGTIQGCMWRKVPLISGLPLGGGVVSPDVTGARHTVAIPTLPCSLITPPVIMPACAY